MSDISDVYRGDSGDRMRNTPNDDGDSEVDSHPRVSPDELAIRRRGRRRIPVVFSPDIDDIKQVIINLLGFIYLDVNFFSNKLFFCLKRKLKRLILDLKISLQIFKLEVYCLQL